ncbi:MAG: DUF1080 domain-containing protein [Terricaulis silvestris]
MAWLRRALACLFSVLALSVCASAAAQPAPHWVALLNGRNLDGWTPKFDGFPLGENYLNTFRVEHGRLVVSYDRYTAMEGHFGHLFYARRPFSNYRLRAIYRFVGHQIPGAPDWALRNNGLMIHSQPPETMGLNQDFPISLEVQLLGGDGVHPRPTANLCTTGTTVLINGARNTEHCINSTSPTFTDGQWATVEVEVHSDQSIRHFVNGVEVMRYSAPQLTEAHPWSPTLELKSGYITIQAESTPTEFRSIEIMDLDPPAAH